MTQPQAIEPALPRTLILSYVTGAGSPTRVRTVAGTITRLAGLVSIAATLSIIAWIAYDAYSYANGWIFFVPGAAGTFHLYLDAIRESLLANVPLVLALPLLTAGGALLPFLGPSIKRGRRVASQLALIWFAIAAVFALITTVVFGLYALGAAGIAFPGPRDFEYLWWLLVVPVGVILTLLLKDMCTYLHWIIRQPAAEMPPVHFVSTSTPMPSPNHQVVQ